MSVMMRRARVDDAPRLAEIAVAAYSAYLSRLPEGVRPAPMDANYKAAIESGEVCIAEDEGQIAGRLVLIPSENHLLLENIAVHPDFQGRGIGRQLLALAEDRAVDLGLRSIRLYTNEVMVENQRLYEHLDYIETDRRREDEFDRVYYEKQL